MTLIVRTLNQLLDEPVESDLGEAEYRRGMADCVGKFFLAIETLPAEVDKSQLEDSVWRWWHEMLRWSRMPLSTQLEPPDIDFSNEAPVKKPQPDKATVQPSISRHRNIL